MALAVPLYHSERLLRWKGGRIWTPPWFRFRPQGAPLPTYSFSSRGWYWVRMPTVSMPEFTQLERGKSMMRYFPPKGTAGFAVFSVRQRRRLPWPPASSMATQRFFWNFMGLSSFISDLAHSRA